MNANDIVDLLMPFDLREREALRTAVDRERVVALNERDEITVKTGAWEGGAEFQRERIEIAAQYALQSARGDLVEIGCFIGETTVVLAKVARQFGRRVIAIDPWEPGTQDSSGIEYQAFRRLTRPYTDVIDVVRRVSQDAEVVEWLKGIDLAFAFVDGLHTYAGALSDIRAVSHAPLIAVDDTNMFGVRLAVEETSKKRSVMQFKHFREVYLH